MILTARYVAPVDGNVIENGAVHIEGTQIVAIGSAKDFGGNADKRIDFGDALLTPGFINAHTHLELSHLAGRVTPTADFPAWLARLVTATSDDAPTKESVQSAVADGIAQSFRAGVTTVGDITRHPAWARAALSASPMRSISFGEVIAIGTRRHLLRERLEAALCGDDESDHLGIALSPHAPYTVEPDALRRCAQRSADRCLPLCVHAAETRDESEFTRDATGAFANYLRTLGVWDDAIPASGLDPIPLLHACGLLTPRTVLAHANYVTDADINRIAQTHTSVAFCPRTHAAFQHFPHRFADMLNAGANVCVGTDSLASNPSLSILDELRFLRESDPKISCEQLLKMGTLFGAKALGLQRFVGSITPGKNADLAILPLSPSADWTEVFRTRMDPVAVVSRGTFVIDKR